MEGEHMGMTIKEAAARAGKAELTIRRRPPSPLITILPPETRSPHPILEEQMRAIREGITADFQQALGHMEAHLHAQLHEELTRVREHITQVTQEVAQATQAQKVQGEAHDREVLQTIREALHERPPLSRKWWPWRW